MTIRSAFESPELFITEIRQDLATGKSRYGKKVDGDTDSNYQPFDDGGADFNNINEGAATVKRESNMNGIRPLNLIDKPISLNFYRSNSPIPPVVVHVIVWQEGGSKGGSRVQQVDGHRPEPKR